MSDEVWKPVPGTDGFYEVSDQGRVRSYVNGRWSNRRAEPRILSPAVSPKVGNHAQLHIYKRTRYVHQLVMEAFCGPRPEGMETRHLNGVPDDNRLVNLAYGTRSDNLLDRVAHGTHHGANKAFCKHGHPFAGENLVMWRRKRRCRTCRRAQSRAASDRRRHARQQQKAQSAA